MTVKELQSLPVGTRVIWNGNPLDFGYVNQFGYGRREKHINWPADGQITLDTDDWALAHVSVQKAEVLK